MSCHFYSVPPKTGDRRKGVGGDGSRPKSDVFVCCFSPFNMQLFRNMKMFALFVRGRSIE